MLVCLHFLDMLILDKLVQHYIRRKGFFLIDTYQLLLAYDEKDFFLKYIIFFTLWKLVG